MSQPQVSVIVPAYNAGDWLGDCVSSVLHQSWQDLELVLVDDGSTDGSVDLVADQWRDERFTVVRQANAGAAAARNTGLAKACGHWLCFLDADDLLAPDKLEQQLRYLANRPDLRLCAASWCRFYEDLPVAPESNADELWQELDPVHWQVLALTGNLMMQPAAWLVRASLVQAAGGWDERLSLNDDGEFFGRLMLQCKHIGFCREAVSYYRSGHAGNLSGGRSERHFASALLALDLLNTALREREATSRTASAMAKAYSRLAVEAYPYQRLIAEASAERAATLDCFSPGQFGGTLAGYLAGVVGWRIARRMQAAVYDLGYRKLTSRRAATRFSTQRAGSDKEAGQ